MSATRGDNAEHDVPQSDENVRGKQEKHDQEHLNVVAGKAAGQGEQCQ